ncbi:MAG TPA: F0F1 ATP synthase subunit gamma, partial [Candidatus Limnocylindrales bacterium]|nr:F0F1 ATP synthase subunit gamma [Candidatus Limnocylindrales bacterium]
MATLREVRRRIASVTNIAQITRAMQMVAASRMKRAQDAILAARPYSDELRAALARVSAAVGAEVDPLTVDLGLLGKVAQDSANRVGVQRSDQASIRRDHDQPDPAHRSAG